MATLTHSGSAGNPSQLLYSVWAYIDDESPAPPYMINLLEAGSGSRMYYAGGKVATSQYVGGPVYLPSDQHRLAPVPYLTDGYTTSTDGSIYVAPLTTAIYLIYDPAGPYGNGLVVQIAGIPDSQALTANLSWGPQGSEGESSAVGTPYVSAYYSHVGGIIPKKWLHFLIAVDVGQESACAGVDVGVSFSSGGGIGGAPDLHAWGYSPPEYDSQVFATGCTILAYLNRRPLTLDKTMCLGNGCRVGDPTKGQIQASLSWVEDGAAIQPSINVAPNIPGQSGDAPAPYDVGTGFSAWSSGVVHVVQYSIATCPVFNATWTSIFRTENEDGDPIDVEGPGFGSNSVSGFDIEWEGAEVGFPFKVGSEITYSMEFGIPYTPDPTRSYNPVPVRWAGVQLFKGLFANPAAPIYSAEDSGLVVGQVMDLFISPSGKFVKPSVAQSVYGTPAISLNGNFSQGQFVNIGTDGALTYTGTIVDADGPPTA